MDSSKKAIQKTLIYSDIFDYPLTFAQLHQFLITKKSISKDVVQKILFGMRDVTQKEGYYILDGREDIVESRKKRERYSKDKLVKATYIAKLLSLVPTVLFIGVSGGVAIQNAEKHDDIDLFIIVRKNTLWSSRIALLFLLQLLSVRRKRTDTEVSDKICLNMIIEEQHMAFEKKRQDLYTAHEIVQLVPLVERAQTYKRFLEANSWVKKFLPHNIVSQNQIDSCYAIPVVSKVMQHILTWRFFSAPLQYIQMKHIRLSQTNETILPTFVAFHPVDYRKKTLIAYNTRVKAL